MKNLKRSLALVLALIMCIGVLAVGASAAVTLDDEDDIKYLTAVQFLFGVGVIDGYEDNTYRPDNPITRAEYAKMICTVMNGGKAPVLGNPSDVSYSDTKGHWASSFIEYLTGLGILAGNGDGTFAPDNTITGQQAAKILLVVMGYDAAYEKLVGGTWDSRADALGNLNHLFDGLEKGFETTDDLKREEAAQIIVNALAQEVRVYWSAGTTGSVGIVAQKSGETLFEFFFDQNVDFIEGVVERNGFGCIYCEAEYDHSSGSGLPTSANHDTYTDVAGFDNSNSQTSWEEGDDLTSFKIFTPAEAIGQSIRVIRYINTRAGIARQTVTLLGTTEYNHLYTTTDVGKVTAKAAGMEIAGAAILRNFGSDDDWIGADSVYYNFNGWKSTFIDNDDGGEAEFVQQYITVPYEVTNITTAGQVTLKDLRNNNTFSKLEGNTGDFPILKGYFFNEDGTEAAVKKGDIILAAIYGGRVWLSDYDTFVGEIDKITHTVYEDKLTIDGETYLLHDTDDSYITGTGAAAKFYHDGSNVANLDAVKVGAELKFYVDEYGFIFHAAVLESTYATPEYAVIIAADDWNLLHARGQTARLVFADGSSSDVLISQLFNTASAKFETISRTNRFNEFDDEALLVAYTVLDDGTYKVAVIADSPELYNDEVTSSWKGLTNSVPKILQADDSYTEDYFTDNGTYYVDVEGLEGYVGYADVPSLKFWKTTTGGVEVPSEVFFVTEYVEKLCYAMFNGMTLDQVLGSASAAKIATMQNHITNLFALSVTYDDVTTTGKNYFYIPDLTAYVEYRIERELVREYDAIVDGVPGKTIIVPATETLIAKQLYYKKSYDTNNILRNYDVVVSDNVNTGDAADIEIAYAAKVVYGEVSYSTRNTLVLDNAIETTYAITANTVFVNAKTDAALTGATVGKKVFAVVSGNTVLQVYQQI